MGSETLSSRADFKSSDTDRALPAVRAAACRYCTRPLDAPFLELGDMPLANAFCEPNGMDSAEFTCPLSVVHCPACHLVQLTHVVPAGRMFSHYLYVSSTSDAFRRHFRDYAAAVCSWFPRDGIGLAVDIGSNDGALVKSFLDKGVPAIGVEPATNLCEDAVRRGVPTINRYFDGACVDEILSGHGPAGVVTANNVFAHVDDVSALCRNVHALLRDDGLFVIECPYIVTMCEQLLFDMIYHEHLSYLSATAVDFMLARHGFEIIGIHDVRSHGGSLRVVAQKQGGSRTGDPAWRGYIERERLGGYHDARAYQAFARQIRQVKTQLRDAVSRERALGRIVAGYGAPAKANTLINYCQWTADDIAYLIDDNPLKQGTVAPGSRIPVVGASALDARPPDTIIVFAWNFADEIVARIKPRVPAAVRWLVPLPAPRVIGTGGGA
jgi:hypothetical protein